MKRIPAYIPNTLTGLNLLCGCVATWFALHYADIFGSLTGCEWAWVFIAGAAFFDFCDGASARLLHAYSPLGKELDSLSDLVSFGVAPAAMVMSAMLEGGDSIWVAACAVAIAIAGAFRLAKFNVDTRQSTSFIGLPIPANAIFWIGVTAWLQGHYYPGMVVMLILIALLSFLMVSEIPMFSLKFANLSLRDNLRRYVIMGATVVFVLTEGVAGLGWTIVLYILISLLGKRTDPDTHAG